MDLSAIDWPALGGTAGATLGAAWYAFGKYSRRRTKKRHDVVAAVAAQTEIYGALQSVIADTGADRAILIKAHNGGKIVEQVGTQIYITIFAEIAFGKVRPVQQDFQVRPVHDFRYMNLIRQVSVAKSVQVWTRDMAEDEMLRGVYEGAGIETAVVTEVLSKTGAYWYMSCAWNWPKDVTASDRASMAAGAGKIGGLLKKDLFR